MSSGHPVGTITQKAVDGATNLIAHTVHMHLGDGRLMRISPRAARAPPTRAKSDRGAMAQQVAHLLCKQGVRGSSPLGSTLVGGGSCQGMAKGVFGLPVVCGPVGVVEPLP
jgi:hypothetical protein